MAIEVAVVSSVQNATLVARCMGNSLVPAISGTRIWYAEHYIGGVIGGVEGGAGSAHLVCLGVVSRVPVVGFQHLELLCGE